MHKYKCSCQYLPVHVHAFTWIPSCMYMWILLYAAGKASAPQNVVQKDHAKLFAGRGVRDAEVVFEALESLCDYKKHKDLPCKAYSTPHPSSWWEKVAICWLKPNLQPRTKNMLCHACTRVVPRSMTVTTRRGRELLQLALCTCSWHTARWDLVNL